MTKNHLANALLFLLLVATCTRPAAAQSGRGRQLRIAERLNRQTSVSVSVPQDASPAAVGSKVTGISARI